MKRIRKITLFSIAFAVLSVFFIVNCSVINSFAEESNDEQAMGFIPDDIRIGDPVQDDSNRSGAESDRGSSLPRKYDARNYGLVTSVKDQGGAGACWAFGSVAAMESALIKNGLASKSINLSELHLMYFMYSENNDPNNMISDDRNYVSADTNYTPTTDFKIIADHGGSHNATGWQITNGVIPYSENGDDYNTCITNSNYKIDQSKCFSSKYKAKKVLSCNLNEKNMDNVKNLIIEYGGVAGDFYCETTTSGEAEKVFFKDYNGTETYHNPNGNNYVTSHVVEIVGWDDDFSANNFKSKPKANGAWLAKNSWGTSNNHDGYVWLSYYDIGQMAKVVAYDFEEKESGESIYQYDGSDIYACPYGYDRDSLTALAFFVSNPSGGKMADVIEKVGVGVDANASYTISILKNPIIENNKLKSYQEYAVTECESTYAGYYEQKLSAPVAIKKGETFAVCVKLAPGSSVLLRAEKIPEGKGITGSIETVTKGQYYRGYSLEGRMYDVELGSFMIKAISNASKYKNVSSLSLNKTSASLNWGKDSEKSVTLSATLLPSEAFPTISWKSSDESVATVTPINNGRSAIVEAQLDGECTITATSVNSSIKATCKITVRNDDEDSYLVKTQKSGDLLWSIDNEGLLYIRGTGDFENSYHYDSGFGFTRDVGPWIEYLDYIKSARVSVKGANSVDYMFYNCVYLESVIFDKLELKKDGYVLGLFYECDNIKQIRMPAGITADINLPDTYGYDYWVDEAGNTCTSCTKGLSNPMTYYIRKNTVLKKGSSVTLKDSNISYGNKISILEFNSAIFIDEINYKEVSGKLTWKDPDYEPDITDKEAEWIFIPDDGIHGPVEGKVSISVKKAVPKVIQTPFADGGIYDPGKTLEEYTLVNGETNVQGTWKWENKRIVPTVGNDGYAVIFTPNDESRYESVSGKVVINIEKATPVIKVYPISESIIYGESLVKSKLTGGKVNYSFTDDTVISGSFEWKNPSIIPDIVDSDVTKYEIKWIPNDFNNYNEIEDVLTVVVNKIKNAPGEPDKEMEVPYTISTVGQIELEDDWTWKEDDKDKELEVGVPVKAIAEYVAEDNYIYEEVVVEITIIRNPMINPTITPTSTPINTPTIAPIIEPTDAPKDEPIKENTEQQTNIPVPSQDINVNPVTPTTPVDTSSPLPSIPEVPTQSAVDSNVTTDPLSPIAETGIYIDDRNIELNDPEVGNVVESAEAQYTITGKNKVSYTCLMSEKERTVVIPDMIKINGSYYTVETIEAEAFAACKKLKKVIIPASVKKIEKNAFRGCKSLKLIIIKSQKLTKKSSFGKNSFKGINKKAVFRCPKSKLKKYKKLLKKAGAPKKAKYKTK